MATFLTTIHQPIPLRLVNWTEPSNWNAFVFLQVPGDIDQILGKLWIHFGRQVGLVVGISIRSS